MPKAKAAVTLADIAESLNTLTGLLIAQAKPVTAAKAVRKPIRKPIRAANVTVIPNLSPEVAALEGQLRPSRAKRIRHFAGLGSAALETYIAGGSKYANALLRGEEAPEARGLIPGFTAHAFASAVLEALKGDKPTAPTRSAKSLSTRERKANVLAILNKAASAELPVPPVETAQPVETA